MLFLEWSLFLRWLFRCCCIVCASHIELEWPQLRQYPYFAKLDFIAPSPQHCDTSMPPPPIHSPASSSQPQVAPPPSPLSCCTKDRPLTFDSARMNARRKERRVTRELFCPALVLIYDVCTMLLNAHSSYGYLIAHGLFLKKAALVYLLQDEVPTNFCIRNHWHWFSTSSL